MVSDTPLYNRGHNVTVHYPTEDITLYPKRGHELNSILHHFHHPAAYANRGPSSVWCVFSVFCEISCVCPRLAAFTYLHTHPTTHTPHTKKNKDKTKKKKSKTKIKQNKTDKHEPFPQSELNYFIASRSPTFLSDISSPCCISFDVKCIMLLIGMFVDSDGRKK